MAFLSIITAMGTTPGPPHIDISGVMCYNISIVLYEMAIANKKGGFHNAETDNFAVAFRLKNG